MNSYDITVRLTIDDEEVPVEVSYTVTSWGCGATGPSFSGPGEPAEPPEFEIDKITFEGENQTGELQWDDLSQKNQETIDEAIYEQLAEGPDDYYEPDFD